MTYDKQDNITFFKGYVTEIFYELWKHLSYLSFHIIVHMLQNFIHEMKKIWNQILIKILSINCSVHLIKFLFFAMHLAHINQASDI